MCVVCVCGGCVCISGVYAGCVSDACGGVRVCMFMWYVYLMCEGVCVVCVCVCVRARACSGHEKHFPFVAWSSLVSLAGGVSFLTDSSSSLWLEGFEEGGFGVERGRWQSQFGHWWKAIYVTAYSLFCQQDTRLCSSSSQCIWGPSCQPSSPECRLSGICELTPYSF